VESALGSQATEIEPQDMAHGVGRIDGETDLVARAAMLRKADELKVAQRVQAQTTKAHSTAAGTAGKPKGFGRRNLAASRAQ